MVADRKLSEAELFQVVGAGWKQQGSEKRKKTFREKLKGETGIFHVPAFSDRFGLCICKCCCKS